MKKTYFEKYQTSEATNTRRVICTPPAFTREHFFHVQEAGYLKSLKPHLSKRSGLQSYLFMIVLSGSGMVSYTPGKGRGRSVVGSPVKNSVDACSNNAIETGVSLDTGVSQGRNAVSARRREIADNAVSTVSAKAHDCFFLDCTNEYTHISSDDDPWELMWVHFYGPQAGAYYAYFSEHNNWHFRSSATNELIACIETILQLHESRTEDTDILAANQIHQILSYICSSASSTNDSVGSSALDSKLQDILRYLNEHFTENISLDALAEQFFISKYYLSREFKKEFGTTIIQYVLMKKINYAKELLRYSNSSIEEIARLCGIDDASYFNKVFKKLEGGTASEYRRKW